MQCFTSKKQIKELNHCISVFQLCVFIHLYLHIYELEIV